jgi:DNA-binding transcriptional LysR family regulator
MHVELNYTDAMKNLVTAGNGVALLPYEAGAPQPDPHITTRPRKPAMLRVLDIARRNKLEDDEIKVMLQTLLSKSENQIKIFKSPKL